MFMEQVSVLENRIALLSDSFGDDVGLVVFIERFSSGVDWYETIKSDLLEDSLVKLLYYGGLQLTTLFFYKSQQETVIYDAEGVIKYCREHDVWVSCFIDEISDLDISMMKVIDARYGLSVRMFTNRVLFKLESRELRARTQHLECLLDLSEEK